MLFPLISTAIYLLHAATRRPLRIKPTYCTFQDHLDPLRFLSDLQCRKVSACNIVVVISCSVWCQSRSPFTACKLELVAVKYPEWQRSNHIELMGFGREFSVCRMVICVWEWGEVFFWNLSHRVKHHRGNAVKEWWEQREMLRKFSLEETGDEVLLLYKVWIFETLLAGH